MDPARLPQHSEGCMRMLDHPAWGLSSKAAADPERELSLASRASTRQDSVAPLSTLRVCSKVQVPPRPSQCKWCKAYFPTRNAMFRHLGAGCAEKNERIRKAKSPERSRRQDLLRTRSPERSRAPSRARDYGPGAPVGVRDVSHSLARPQERSRAGDGEWSDGRGEDDDDDTGYNICQPSPAIPLTRPEIPITLAKPVGQISVGCDKQSKARSSESQRPAEVEASEFVREVAGSPVNDTFKLCKIEGEGPPCIQFAGRAHFVLGRSSQAGVTMTSMAFSRFHIQLVHNKQDGQAYVIDLNSSNGTFVNDKRVRSGVPHLLRLGDRICVGADVTTRVSYAVSAIFGESAAVLSVKDSLQSAIHRNGQVHSSNDSGLHDGKKMRKAVQVAQDAQYAVALQRKISSTTSVPLTQKQSAAEIQPNVVNQPSRAGADNELPVKPRAQLIATSEEVASKGPLCVCKSGKPFSHCHQPLVLKRQLAQARDIATESSAKRAKTEVKRPDEGCLQTNVPDSSAVEQTRGNVGEEHATTKPPVKQACADCHKRKKRCVHFSHTTPRASQTHGETKPELDQERVSMEKKTCGDSSTACASAEFQQPAAVTFPVPSVPHTEPQQEPGPDISKALLTAQEKTEAKTEPEASSLCALPEAEVGQGAVKTESELAEDLVGWRVKVYWAGEAAWFWGYVIDVFIGRKKARKPCIKVLYDDGDIQDEKMEDVRWIAKVEEPEGDSVVGWRVKCLHESKNEWLPAIVTDSISEDEVQIMFQDGVVMKEAREEVLWISAPLRMSKAKKTHKSVPSTLALSAALPPPMMMAALPATSDPIRAPPATRVSKSASKDEQDSTIMNDRTRPSISIFLPLEADRTPSSSPEADKSPSSSPKLASETGEVLPAKDNNVCVMADDCGKKTREEATKPNALAEHSCAGNLERIATCHELSEEKRRLAEPEMVSAAAPDEEMADEVVDVSVLDVSVPHSKGTVKRKTHKRKLDQASVADAGEDDQDKKGKEYALNDKCYECKFGQFARRKNSPKQCRSSAGSAVKGAMGHTECNWQDDVRTTSVMSELEAPKKVIKAAGVDSLESMPSESRSTADKDDSVAMQVLRRSDDMVESADASWSASQATAREQHLAALCEYDVVDANEADAKFLGDFFQDDGGTCRDELESMIQDETNRECLAGWGDSCAALIEEPSDAQDAERQTKAGACTGGVDVSPVQARPMKDDEIAPSPNSFMGKLEWLMGVPL